MPYTPHPTAVEKDRNNPQAIAHPIGSPNDQLSDWMSVMTIV